MLLKAKLKACRHENVNIYEYVRNDSIFDELLYESNQQKIDSIKDHLAGIRFCLDCGATQGFKLRDPLHGEEWLAPWLWR